MKFIIIGSGGCVCLPKPLCRCRVCAEAREKGGRYRRYGCSLYLEDASLIVDTPEDIAHALNSADIRSVDKRKAVSLFIFEENGRRVIYAPCDCKPFPINKHMKNADLLIIGNTFVGDRLKNNRIVNANHPLRRELHSMEDVMQIKEKLSVADVIVTHIEEDWGKSYDDYTTLEAGYPGVRFAYDGMKIQV